VAVATRVSEARRSGPGLVLAIVLAIVTTVRADDFSATVDTTSSGTLTGRLERVDAEGVRVTVDGAARALPLDGVRAVTLSAAAAAAAPPTVAVTCADGSRLSGTDVVWHDDTLTLAHPAGPITLPSARARMIVWDGGSGDPAWLAAVPADEESDLLVVRKGDGFEFVACAITAISPETVTVVLDEETIPVKRGKVLGVRWLRDAAPRGRVWVSVDGGRLAASDVTWTADGLVVDGAIRLPAAVLRSIDYAAGRTVRLATLPTDQLDVEPFFGALGSIEGLSRYFVPRPVPAAGDRSPPGLVIRPRTVAVWRIPAGGRRFRTRLASAADAGPATVTISVDDRRVFEQVVSGQEATPVELDLAGGRRLGVTVDFGPAGALAGAVRLEEPVIEQ